MFNLNRFIVGDSCSLARSHTISEMMDSFLRPVQFLQSAKEFTWEKLESLSSGNVLMDFQESHFVQSVNLK